jgi:hypothetical protein
MRKQPMPKSRGLIKLVYKTVNKPLKFFMSYLNGIQEVRGSTPLGSTICPPELN